MDGTPGPRQRLLDAAADLFYRRGIGAVGVDLVSSTARVSKRTLYQQFGSKDRLVAESLDARGPAVLGLYVPAQDDNSPPRAGILAVFAALQGWVSSGSFRGCPFLNTATELADPAHPARRVARGYKLRLREYFRAQAEAGGAADPHRLADQLMIIFDGAVAQAVQQTTANTAAAREAAEILLSAHGIGEPAPARPSTGIH